MPSARRRPPDASTAPRTSAREHTLQDLRQRIVSLRLAPGSVVNEQELAAELGVSRTPVRESLILLRGEGLVEVFPQVGTFVTLVDPHRIAQAQFVREAIECASLEAVDLPLHPDDQEALQENLRRQDVAAADNDPETFFALDEQFHRTLLRASGHEDAWTTVTSAKAHLDRARRMSLVDTRPLPTLVAQHRAIATAMADGSSAIAVDRLRTHLRAVFDDVEAIQAARPELFSATTSPRPRRDVRLG